MATKAQQNDDGTVSDSVTKENQKGYANYEAENAKKQREMETKDAKFKESVKSGVEKIRGFIGMKKGGKVKKFNDGGMSLEEKYPEAKITRAGPQPKPEEYSANRIKLGDPHDIKKDRSDSRTLAPYERKAEKMEKRSPSRGGVGGGDFSGMKGLDKPFKSGGKVYSASKRADGCAIRGKTRA